MKVTIHPLSDLPTPPQGLVPDQGVIERLERSFQTLKRHDRQLAERFYARLFASHPELRPMFPADMTAQMHKLMDTLTMVFENLRAPQSFREVIRNLGMRHVAYGTKLEHYPIICEQLVAAMAEILGPQWSMELQADWTCAMRLISEVMMDSMKAKK